MCFVEELGWEARIPQGRLANRKSNQALTAEAARGQRIRGFPVLPQTFVRLPAFTGILEPMSLDMSLLRTRILAATLNPRILRQLIVGEVCESTTVDGQ